MVALLRFLASFVGDSFPTPLLVVIGLMCQDAGLLLLAIVWHFFQRLLASEARWTVGGVLVAVLLWLAISIVYLVYGPLE